jgi:hypothetical protein
MITARIVVASILTAAIARLVWALLDRVAGVSFVGQLVSVGVAVAASGVFYGWAVLRMRIPEARQIERLVRGRLSAARA